MLDADSSDRRDGRHKQVASPKPIRGRRTVGHKKTGAADKHQMSPQTWYLPAPSDYADCLAFVGQNNGR